MASPTICDAPQDATLAKIGPPDPALPTILVVDDDPQMLRLIRAALAKTRRDVVGVPRSPSA